MSQVVLQKLTKKFGDVMAVDGIDLHVQDKELLVLVGPSGCGKSTTLRMIAGLEEITSGTIQIGEQVVNHIAPKDRNIAMVFQNYALYPHMNVYNNMAFGLKMRKVSRKEIAEKIQRASEILGIDGLLERKPAQLSGGQRQRVAVGRAIVRDPEVFLFDEPLSNLDAKLRVNMRSELVKLHQRLETTMIYVTHDQVEAMTMGDRIVVMHEGRIQQVATPLEVYDSPANRFVAEFIGSPAMNLLSGKLIGENGLLKVDFDDFSLKILADHSDIYKSLLGQAVVFGIRPENISLDTPAASKGDWQSTSGKVIVSQLLGSESVVELACGSHRLQARVDAHTSHFPGTEINVYFNMSKSHLFDSETDKRIKN